MPEDKPPLYPETERDFLTMISAVAVWVIPLAIIAVLILKSR